jgi:hypothetical protein
VINWVVSKVHVRALTVIITTFSVAASLGISPSSASGTAGPKVQDGLHLQYENVPTMHEKFVFVRGVVPQIDYNYLNGHRNSPSVHNVLGINSDIETLAATLEKRYWQTLLKYCLPQFKSFSGLERVPGNFELQMNTSLILANNATLSFVIPTSNNICEGTGNEQAISSTYSLQTGRQIDLLTTLFVNRLAGEQLLARLAMKQFYGGKASGDRCIQDQGGAVSQKEMLAYVEKANSLGVTHVALAKTGIAVLIDQCYLTACACGDSLATIPYTKIWKALSKQGRALVTGTN